MLAITRRVNGSNRVVSRMAALVVMKPAIGQSASGPKKVFQPSAHICVTDAKKLPNRDQSVQFRFRLKRWTAIDAALISAVTTMLLIANNRLLKPQKVGGHAATAIEGHNRIFSQPLNANDAENTCNGAGERSAVRNNQLMQDGRRKSVCESYRPVEK